ncbi:MAG: hypothetical protein K6F35_12905 [Lachnospiraceae bacterium]|nr:hypothetical protein [Lachnospiraceae bacterium]
MSENYLRLLIESQDKKYSLLNEAEELDEELMRLIREEKPDMEALDANMNAKGRIAQELDQLDDGFEAVYEKVRDELKEHKEQYREEILTLKEQISRITEKTVKIRALEERNKKALDLFFEDQRKKVKAGRSSVKIANAYAVNMRKINKVDSFFLDKKK